MDFRVTERWHTSFPGAHVGVLLICRVDNAGHTTSLDTRKREVENELRKAFVGRTRAELLEHEVLQAYHNFYRAFGNTYHVQLQLESVIHKNKPLPNVSPSSTRISSLNSRPSFLPPDMTRTCSRGR